MTSEMDQNELQKLAELVQCRNRVEREISALIGRPAVLGNLGEYIAARIFSIRLTKNAAHQSIDGYFSEGPLAPCSVNIKWYAVREGVLVIIPGFLPDFYLVLVGPPPTLTAQLQIRSRPWLIKSVHLFDVNRLVDNLEERGVRVGAASSVRRELWEAAEIFPNPKCKLYPVSTEQYHLLKLYQ